jgi:hypothetical protein
MSKVSTFVSLALVTVLALLGSGCAVFSGGVPEWIDNPGSVGGALAAAGSAPILGPESAARDSAAANGRAQLAASLKAEINQLIEDWSKQAGNLKIQGSLSSYINNENFTRQYVDTMIMGGRPVEFYKKDQTMYCLVVLDIENTKRWYDAMSGAIEMEAMRQAALWESEALKAQARARLDEVKRQHLEAQLEKIRELKGDA